MADLTVLLLKDRLDFIQAEIDRNRDKDGGFSKTNEIFPTIRDLHERAACLLGYSFASYTTPEQRIIWLTTALELAGVGVDTIKLYHGQRIL